MQIKTKTYRLYNCEIVEPILPDGWQVIDVYSPRITPWDYYGMKHRRELSYVLAQAGIEHVCVEKRYKNLAPTGTGPGGMIRFGDNMMPSEYWIAVKTADIAKAKEELHIHQLRVLNWIHNNGPMPEACGL